MANDRALPRSRINPHDLVDLGDAIAAAEEIDEAADLHRGRVMPGRRQPPDLTRATCRRHQD